MWHEDMSSLEVRMRDNTRSAMSLLTQTVHIYPPQSFGSLLDETVAEGKLSASRVERVRDAAVKCMNVSQCVTIPIT